MRRVVVAALMWGAIVSGAKAQESCEAPNTAPIETSARRAPGQILARTNQAARQGPESGAFVAARQIYAFAPGALYELHANPNFISTILLEPGERLNQIAAGDTNRWMVAQAEAESEIAARTLVLVKPHAIGLRTNIVLITDRRTYLVEAIAQAGEAYAAEISWCYEQEAGARAPDPSVLNFAYRVRTVRGRRPAWSPLRVYDDGRRTFIDFADSVAAQDLPPLFLSTSEGLELVNYRVDGHRYVIDRLFARAQLRLGARAPIIVQIERQSAPSRS